MKLRPRAIPLAPRAMIVRGPDAVALARRLREIKLAGVRGVTWRDAIALFADAPDALPWIDRACWLGRDPLAPSLFLPTRLELDVHPELVRAALSRKVTADRFPVAIAPNGDRIDVIPLGEAREPTVQALDAFLGARS